MESEPQGESAQQDQRLKKRQLKGNADEVEALGSVTSGGQLQEGSGLGSRRSMVRIWEEA